MVSKRVWTAYNLSVFFCDCVVCACIGVKLFQHSLAMATQKLYMRFPWWYFMRWEVICRFQWRKRTVLFALSVMLLMHVTVSVRVNGDTQVYHVGGCVQDLTVQLVFMSACYWWLSRTSYPSTSPISPACCWKLKKEVETGLDHRLYYHPLDYSVICKQPYHRCQFFRTIIDVCHEQAGPKKTHRVHPISAGELTQATEEVGDPCDGTALDV